MSIETKTSHMQPSTEAQAVARLEAPRHIGYETIEAEIDKMARADGPSAYRDEKKAAIRGIHEEAKKRIPTEDLRIVTPLPSDTIATYQNPKEGLKDVNRYPVPPLLGDRMRILRPGMTIEPATYSLEEGTRTPTTLSNINGKLHVNGKKKSFTRIKTGLKIKRSL